METTSASVEGHQDRVVVPMDTDATINIVTGADDAFAMPMAVTVYPGLANLEQGRSVCIYVMQGGISDRNRRKLEETLDTKHVNAQVRWLKPDLSRLEGMHVAACLKSPSYLRLFIPELLLDHCRRALQLDGDGDREGSRVPMGLTDWRRSRLGRAELFLTTR
jgi:hypothetical protein